MYSYPGGKNIISDWIIKEMNALCRNTNFKWKHYAEPFSGAFWVYLKLPMERIRNFETVVYNDFNFELVNTITCLRDARQELIDAPKNLVEELQLKNERGKLILEDEDNYEYIKEWFFSKYRNEKDPKKTPDPLRVIQFSYLHNYAFIGSVLSPKMKMVRNKLKANEKTKDMPIVKKAKNPEFINRIERVTHIEQIDCEEVIRKYDSDEMFFYLDPPYWKTEHYYTESVDGFGPDKHESLANTIKAMKGRFALSYYSFPELEEWFPEEDYRWERKIYTCIMQSKSNSDREEVLILNDKGEEGLLGY